MLVIGIAEIIIITIIAIGALMLALGLARALGAGKNRSQSNRVTADVAAGADFDGIRTRIERRYRRRFELAAHVVFYVFIVGGLWLLRMPPPALPLLAGVWALVLALHALQFIFAEFTDRAIEREIERERARVYGSDKPKRDRKVRLSDEGELIDVAEDEWDDGDQQQRRR
ncbi:MAG: hypothetical protein HZC41_23650 [Chloroflexi bacterium]|nr:hypothetical protein [Chloroflexota bacterium]